MSQKSLGVCNRRFGSVLINFGSVFRFMVFQIPNPKLNHFILVSFGFFFNTVWLLWSVVTVSVINGVRNEVVR